MKTLNIIISTLVLSTLLISCEKNENAPDIADQAYSIAENSPVGTIVGNAYALDRDEGQYLTYEITDGNEDGAFAIHPTFGTISVADPAFLDYETKTQFLITVTVSDNHKNEPLESAASITINVTDVNEHTPVIETQVFEIDENPDTGDLIGMIIASNEETHQSLSFSIAAHNDNGYFQIDPQSGALTVADSTGFDFESNEQLILLVKVEDDHEQSLSSIASITVNINDVFETLEGLMHLN